MPALIAWFMTSFPQKPNAISDIETFLLFFLYFARPWKSRRFSFQVWHLARILAGIAQVQHAALEALLPEALPRRRAPHFFDKAGHIPVPFALSGKKCFQMPGDNPIQRILFRIERPGRRRRWPQMHRTRLTIPSITASTCCVVASMKNPAKRRLSPRVCRAFADFGHR